MATYKIIESPPDGVAGVGLVYQPHGGVLKFWKSKNHEVILSGAAETGKTRGVLEWLDAVAWKYPGAQLAIVRKTYKSLVTSVLQTYEKKVLGAWNPNLNEGRGGFDSSLTPVKKFGGSSPAWFTYPNGSKIYLGGMDNPDKVLSSERDIIYVNQAEELTLDDWEKLATRTTGRAGNMPYSKLVGDCNPADINHWIKQRAADGALELIETRHEDNPTLFNPETGEITEQGRRTLEILDNLTGVRYLRLRKGIWATAEGVIYDNFDPAVHVINRFRIPKDWRRIVSIDFGLVHPFVAQWWAIDNDGRMYMYREIYMTGRTVRAHAEQIKEYSRGENIEMFICDHDAEDTLTLNENGIYNTQKAYKAVNRGIEHVQLRLKARADGKPGIFFFNDALVEIDQNQKLNKKPVRTIEEFGSYTWNPTKEQPIKVNDDGMDATRYAVAYIDRIGETPNVSVILSRAARRG